MRPSWHQRASTQISLCRSPPVSSDPRCDVVHVGENWRRTAHTMMPLVANTGWQPLQKPRVGENYNILFNWDDAWKWVHLPKGEGVVKTALKHIPNINVTRKHSETYLFKEWEFYPACGRCYLRGTLKKTTVWAVCLGAGRAVCSGSSRVGEGQAEA